MHRGSRIALLLCSAILACTSRAEAPDSVAHPARVALRRDALGCWALRERFGLSAEGSIDWAPTYVALLSGDAAGPAFAGRRAVRYDSNWRPLPLELERGIPGLNSWRADSLTDTIRIAFNNAFSGSVFVLAMPEHDRPSQILYGRAYEFYDAGPPFSKSMGAASAKRVSCPKLLESGV